MDNITVINAHLRMGVIFMFTALSGSPIIQNGKLIGAVTHVFVSDSRKGYGIFAENMLETAQSVAKENKFKEVS